MPLVKRAVSPVDVSRGCIPPQLTNNELQCVANGTLANLIRQLSSLSKHAEHIFGEIYLDAMKLDHKSNILQQRVERLTTKVKQLDANNEQASLGEVQMRKAFKSSMLIDQHTLDRSTLPTALSEAYAKCDKPPNLDALNPYRDDPNPALSYYTNPAFFFDLWRQEMLKDVPAESRRRVKSPSEGQGSKSPKKKRRPVQGQVPQDDVGRNHMNRLMHSARQQYGALSFPEEYQAPQALGLQLHRNQHGYQPPSSTSIVPPPGMSVRAVPIVSEHRNDLRPSVSPPKEFSKRDLPPPDMSLLAIDDEDDLPPPPPTLMCTSIVQHMPTQPQTNIQMVPVQPQAVQPAQEMPNMPTMPNTAPPPPPPPPPPPNLLAPVATFTSATKKDESMPEAKNDSRNDLLAEIRNGKELRKVRRAEEEEQERSALHSNDVAAVLRRRLEQMQSATVGDDDSASSNDDDNEWDD